MTGICTYVATKVYVDVYLHVCVSGILKWERGDAGSAASFLAVIGVPANENQTMMR